MLQRIKTDPLVACPCCGQSLSSPQLDAIIIDRLLTPMEAAILRRLWKAKGDFVRTSQIINAMYADDPDGGPSEIQMRNTMNILIHRMRKKLQASGVGIEYNRQKYGHRLVFIPIKTPSRPLQKIRSRLRCNHASQLAFEL